jgi:hypothetical protein
MPTRPTLAGRERRVYALVASLPYSGAQTAFFSLDMTIESFLEGHVRAFEWLGGVPRECVYDNLRSVVARRDGDEVVWNRRFLHLRGHYGFHATACTPATPREKGSVEAGVRYLKSGFWPARRFDELRELDEQYTGWRERTCNRRTHASGRFPVEERLAEERQALRPLPPLRFDWSGHRTSRVPIDAYLRHGRCFYRAPERLVHERVELCFDRDQVWIVHRGVEVARYPRSYEHGLWLPPPIMRAEPPITPPAPLVLSRLTVAPPELADYAELCTGARRKWASGCPTCSRSSKRRGCSSGSSRQRRSRASRSGHTSVSWRPCSRPRSSPATPPAPACASARLASRRSRRSKTSTGARNRARRSRSCST